MTLTAPFLPEYLQKQIHPQKNDITKIKTITSGSNKKIWWICDKGHEWETSPNSRISLKRNCPYCSNQKVLSGYNDLKTLYPEIAEQWEFELNSPITPDKIISNTEKSFWFTCSKQHKSYEKVKNRKNRGTCLICTNKQLLTGFNDLRTTHPEVATQWHPTKNGNLKPENVLSTNTTKRWFLCPNKHEWETTPYNLTQRNTKCTKCIRSKTYTASITNNIKETNPEISIQWHPTKNGNLKPENVTKGVNKKIWWICDKGHEWEATVNTRTKNHGCPYCFNKKVLSSYNNITVTNPALAAQYHFTKNLVNPPKMTYGSNQKVWWVCDKGHEWEATVKDRSRGTNCPTCSKNYSSPEEKIAQHLTKLGVPYIRNDKTKINPHELDFYLPTNNIAIEFNGLYWHSENKGKGKNYHYNKWSECQKQGIQLLQIWEDDWNTNPELVLTTITHKLHKNNTPAVYARNTIIEKISQQEAKIFLNKNHIQGFASGSRYLGLKTKVNNNLTAVMVTKKQPLETIDIIRYATATRTVGGFSKLLKYIETTYQPKKIITFADHTISNGNLYQTNGFNIAKELKPDYKYIVNKKRVHKFGYRLDRFKKDPNLIWQPNLTERELAEINNLPRIWDAGKTKYEKLLGTTQSNDKILLKENK